MVGLIQGAFVGSSAELGPTTETVSFAGSDYNWVHDLALRTGRLVAGPAGKTSTEYTQTHVLATLENQGQVLQEVHVAKGDALRLLRGGQTLLSQPIRPLPEIRSLPEPEPVVAAPTTTTPSAATAAGVTAAPEAISSATVPGFVGGALGPPAATADTTPAD